MKTISIVMIVLCTKCAGFSQGVYGMQNYSMSVNAPVFDAAGVPLYGNDYLAELYGGPTPDSLSPAREDGVTVPYRATFTYTPGGQHGYFRGAGFATIDGVYPGYFGYLQVRAWDARLGNSYEEVVAKNMGGYGASSIIYVQSGGVGGPPSPPAELLGLQSFSLLPAPEPGTWALLGTGLVLLYAKCKRRNQV